MVPTTGSADLSTESKYASQFDNCRLAFDGTHIPAFVGMENAKPFRDRNGKLSQNVFAACTFDMMFAYVLAGWEDKIHGNILCSVHTILTKVTQQGLQLIRQFSLTLDAGDFVRQQTCSTWEMQDSRSQNLS